MVEVEIREKQKNYLSLSAPLSVRPTHLPQQALHPQVALLHPSRGVGHLVLDRHGQHSLVGELVTDGAGDLRELTEATLDVGEGATVLPRGGVFEFLFEVDVLFRAKEERKPS